MRRRPATQREATATVHDDGSMTHEPLQTSSGLPLSGEAQSTRTTRDTRSPLTGQPSSARSHGRGDPRHEESSGELLAGHSEVGHLPRPAEHPGQDPPPWAWRPHGTPRTIIVQTEGRRAFNPLHFGPALNVSPPSASLVLPFGRGMSILCLLTAEFRSTEHRDLTGSQRESRLPPHGGYLGARRG